MLSSPLIFLCKTFLCVTLFYSERITEKEEYFYVILTNVLPEIPFRARMQVELTGLCFTFMIPVPVSQPADITKGQKMAVWPVSPIIHI